MCNLYDIGPSQGKRNETVWEQIVFRGLSQFAAKNRVFGIRKTDPGLVFLSESEFSTMRWGFDRPFNTSINNTRVDKLANGMWQPAWEEGRRCVIPLTTYYEWTGPTGKKNTHAFQCDQIGEWLWAAGVWEDSAEFGPCYSMITTGPSKTTQHIHDRMPALLSEARLNDYLNERDPRVMLEPCDALTIFECENPLKNPKEHQGPIEIPLLPGF